MPITRFGQWFMLALVIGCGRADRPAGPVDPPAAAEQPALPIQPPAPVPPPGPVPVAQDQPGPAGTQDIPLAEDEYPLALSPGATTVAVRGRGNAGVELRDVATGKVRQRVPVIEFGNPEQGTFTADGKQLALAAGWAGVTLVDTATGRHILLETIPGGHVGAVAFAADGKTLAAGSDIRVRRWALSGDTPRQLEPDFNLRDRVGALAYHPDGTKLAAGAGTALALLDVATGQEAWRVPAHSGHVTSIAFSPDGGRIVTAARGVDTTVRVWAAADGKAVASLPHPAIAIAAFYSADGGTILTATADGFLHAWDAAAGTRIASRRWRQPDSYMLDTGRIAPDRSAVLLSRLTTSKLFRAAALTSGAVKAANEPLPPSPDRPTPYLPVRLTLTDLKDGPSAIHFAAIVAGSSE
ncbi:MAG TPA: hypothetical protein VH092_29305 [Urbifossiella sp.]|nr:hypothetical protein [Urbifossiella sp.]